MRQIQYKISGRVRHAYWRGYALYDSLQDFEQDNDWDFLQIDDEEFVGLFTRLKHRLNEIVTSDPTVLMFIKDTKHLYSLWGFLVQVELENAELVFSLEKYKSLMEYCASMKSSSQAPIEGEISDARYKYYLNSQGASTELPQRQNRHEALINIML